MFRNWRIWALALIAIVALVGCSSADDEAQEEDSQEEQTEEAASEPVEEEAEESEESEEEESEPLTREEELEAAATKIIEDDFNKTNISEIKVNYNAGLDDGSYLVLPHLVWDVKNGAGTTKDMLEQYSDHLAAKLADEGDISEITVFWEVPYHLEGDNIAKFNYTPADGGMAKGDIWFDSILD